MAYMNDDDYDTSGAAIRTKLPEVDDTLGAAIRAKLPNATDAHLLHIFDKGLKLFQYEQLSQKITYIINYLTAPSKDTRHEIVPAFWYNVGTVDQFDLNENANQYEVYVTSYIGGGETDGVWFDIPKIWVESDNWKSLIDQDIQRQQQTRDERNKQLQLEAKIKTDEAERVLYEKLRVKFEKSKVRKIVFRYMCYTTLY